MASGSVQEIKSYLKRQVKKHFAGYGTFKGLVDRVDTRGKDDKPFHVTYEDGDHEWVTKQELAQIIVGGLNADDAAAAAWDKAGSTLTPKASSDAPTPKKRGRPPSASKAAAAAAAAAMETAKQDEQQPAEAAEEGEAAAVPAKRPKSSKTEQREKPADSHHKAKHPERQRELKPDKQRQVKPDKLAKPEQKQEKHQKQHRDPGAASAVAAASGLPGKRNQQEQPPAKAAAGGSAAVSNKTPAKSTPGAAGTPEAAAKRPASDINGLMADIHKTAQATGQRLEADRGITRLDFKGSGSTALPAMAMGVVAGGTCEVLLYSSSRARSSLSPYGSAAAAAAAAAASAAIDYQAEAEQLLAELEKRLAACGTHKNMLVKVTVYLRSITDGMPGFKAAWNAWVDRARLPVLLILEGSGPFTASGIVLQATASSSSM